MPHHGVHGIAEQASRGDDANSAAAYDLATGELRWQIELFNLARATVTPIDDGTVLITGGGHAENGMSAVTLSTGRINWQVVSSPPPRSDHSPLIAGGALYQAELDTVRAIRLPEQAGQWEVTLPNQTSRISMPVPHGFVVEDLTGLVGHLVGYLD